MAVYHTLLQYDLGEFLVELLRVTGSHARLLASQMAFGKLLVVLSTASHDAIADPELRAEFLALLKRAGTADEMRNRLVHSIWAVPLQLLFSEDVLRLKPKAARARPYSEPHEVVTPSAVQENAAALRQLVDDVAYYRSRFVEAAQLDAGSDGDSRPT